MTRLEIITQIMASPERCFDLSRDLDLHVRSMKSTGERAIAGRTSGLIELDEQVTWRARAFGLTHYHTSRITSFDRPRHFRDEMVEGRFETFKHDHYFEKADGGTRMTDVIDFQAPYGVLGRIVDFIILKPYLRALIDVRNQTIRTEAEDGSTSE